MPYPQYRIDFVEETGSLTTGARTGLTSITGVDGSHTHSLVLDGLQIEVTLTHNDKADLFPKLIITYMRK